MPKSWSKRCCGAEIVTTIAYKNGVMATDSRAYAGENISLGEKAKITAIETPTGCAIIGLSTTLPGLTERLWAWFADGEIEEDMPELKGAQFTALVVRTSGVFFYNSNPYPSGPIEAPCYAVGSGAAYALGAMHMGATAVQAIQIAKELDVWSGGKTRMIETKNHWPS